MRSLYFCTDCGSTIDKTMTLEIPCPECKAFNMIDPPQASFFNYKMQEFIGPLYERDNLLFWEESLLSDRGTAIYLMPLPRNYGIVPRRRYNYTNDGMPIISHIYLKDIT